MRLQFVVPALVLPVLLLGQEQRWVRLYDGGGGTDYIGGASQAPDSTYRIVLAYNTGAVGNAKIIGVALDGTWLWSTTANDTTGTLFGGGTQCLQRRADGTWLWAGGGIPSGTSQYDGILYCFSPNGDSLWSRWYTTMNTEAFLGMSLTGDGGAALVGYEDGPIRSAKLVRVDANGDTLWTKRYTNAQDYGQTAISIDTTADGGFVISGYRTITGLNSDMWVIRTNPSGQGLWQVTLGSPWHDSQAYASVLHNGHIAVAGGEPEFPLTSIRPVLYKLAPNGVDHMVSFDPMWMDQGAYRTKPVELGNGDVVIGGFREVNLVNRGMLVRVDSTGNVVWNRHYQTGNHDHYITGLERTLDGGFLLSGTAYDSLGISVDGWLLKVDSFGCVVPGCQSLTGLLEQEIEPSTFLSVRPNPLLRSHASTELMVELRSMPDREVTGPFKLVFTSGTGAVVHQVALTGPSTTIRLPEHMTAGLYHVHLMAGSRWVDGSKLVVE
ncbi:MAG: hypothetical protein IPM49_00785 [Flavobacteriales bacterium]|nr:hypothetical protein [Flavobacteriales bacterium]